MLYHLQFDHESYYVEAPTIAVAVFAWKEHVKKEWGDDCDGTEEPESIALIYEGAVIR